MRRGLVIAALTLAGAVACGSDDPATESQQSTTTTTTTSTTTTTTTTTSTTTTTLFPAPEVSTVTDLLALDRPIVAAHAGGDQSSPHSTMFAFREAARAGVDVLEMDVQLTGDGVLIVQHDDTVDRTTERRGTVRDFTLEELQALDNAYWWSSEWSSRDQPAEAYVWRGVRTGAVEPPPTYTADDFRIETFRSIAQAFPDHILDIEIKVPGTVGDPDDMSFAIEGARVLADEIAALDRTDSVIVVSFNADVIKAFRDFAPDVATSPSVEELLAWFFGTGTFDDQDVVAQVPPDFDGIEVLTPGIIDRVRAEGLEIWVWPNDVAAQENAAYYLEIAQLGLDGIIAGHPEDAVEVYRSNGYFG